MKRIALLVSVILFCFGCKENSSEPDIINPEKRIKVTGQIVCSDSTSLLDSIKIILVGEITYSDTTDNQGFFEFLIEEQETFHLIINSEGYNHVDSVFVIKSDTSIIVNLQPILNIGNDYYPLSIGNWWEYSFIYYPEACYSYGNWREGIIKWEITDKYVEDSFVRYIIEETVNGKDVFYRLDNTGIDTTYYENLKTEIEVFEYSDGSIVHKGGFIYKHLKFSRYYQDSTTIVLNCNFWPIDDEETYSLENLLDDLGHRLILTQNVGIRKWQIANSGNCSPKGNLTLVNYKIIE